MLARLAKRDYFQLACGGYQLTVVCSSIECPEAGAEIRRRQEEEVRLRQRRASQEEEALLRLHGCTMIGRPGGTAYELSCGTHRLTVECSWPECPEAGAELRRRHDKQAQARETDRLKRLEEALRRLYNCRVVTWLDDSRFDLICGEQHFIVTCSSEECPEAGRELARRRALARSGCTVLASLGPRTYQVSCGLHGFVAFCSSTECNEVDDEITGRWQEALRRRHGCRLITRIGTSRLDVLCGNRRLRVVCSSIDCPEIRAARE
ncbi:MAG: hypothetical protein J2P50_12130 [Hyphomicrobiaceae bacterium]|nr:hypothetical protein [Hyphomicrobiaceae bacterium]